MQGYCLSRESATRAQMFMLSTYCIRLTNFRKKRCVSTPRSFLVFWRKQDLSTGNNESNLKQSFTGCVPWASSILLAMSFPIFESYSPGSFMELVGQELDLEGKSWIWRKEQMPVVDDKALRWTGVLRLR